MQTNHKPQLSLELRMDAATKESLGTPFINHMIHSKNRPIYGQGMVAALVYLTAACNGLSSGYSAILLPQLRGNSSTMIVDEDIQSWIVSLYIGTTSIGCLLSGIVMNAWGRRLTVQIAVACNCLGWVFIAVANSNALMLIGRALGGFGKGFSTPAITFHVEEMADPRLRGALSACILLTYSFGIMLISMLGINISWQISAGIGAVVSLLNLIGYSLLPESPVWLVRNERLSQASDVFKWLWGGNHDAHVERDLQELLQRIKAENREMNKIGRRQFFKAHIVKPFIIIHLFNLLQIVCGTNLFIFYAVDIISGMRTVDVNLTNILTSTTRVVFMAISCVTLVWVGRRTLCVSSGVGSGFALSVLATLLYWDITPAWLLTTLMLIYVAFNTYGYFVLPPSMIGEILPSSIRCIAGAYIFTLNDVGMFAATKAFPYVAREVGTHGLFWIFGGSSLFCALFLYLLLPETKGRSLVEVEQYFLQSNILWINRKNKNIPL